MALLFLWTVVHCSCAGAAATVAHVFLGGGRVLAWVAASWPGPRGRGCWADLGGRVRRRVRRRVCVCAISYLLSRCMRPYWIMTAAGFSCMTLSRHGPVPILAGLPNPLLLSPPERRDKGKTKEKNILSGLHPGSLLLHPPQPPLAQTRTPLPPPPSSRRGPRKRVFRCRGRPALYVAVKATSTLSLRPCGPVFGAHPFKCGWGGL